MWRLRIEQYFQVQDYALWDVIENGNSFKTAAKTTTSANGTSTTLTPGPVTTEEKVQKKNDMKAKSMLLMALPNEHLMTFNQYKDTKTLFAAIQTRFDGNEATKKTQKTLLKKMYENFSAPSTESLDSIFNRLQKIELQAQAQAQVLRIWLLCHPLAVLMKLILLMELVLLTLKSALLEDNKVFLENCYMEDDEVPTNIALMAFSDSEVHNDQTCSKTCLKNFETLKTQFDDLRIEFNKSEFNLATYKRWLASIEEQLVFYKKNEVIFWEQIAVLKKDISYKDSTISMLKSELENLKQEKESNQLKIENFENASKSLHKLIGSQITDKSRKGMGFIRYNVVPPPPTGLFLPPKFDLSNSGLEEFQQPEFEGYGPKTSKSVSEDISDEVRESPDAPLGEELVSDDKLEKKTVFPTVTKMEFVRPKQQEKPGRNPVKLTANTIKGKGRPKAVNTSRPNSAVVNVVRANQVMLLRPRHVGFGDLPNLIAHDREHVLSLDIKEFDGGCVTFRGGVKGGKITDKGTLKTGKLDFVDVYFVKELQFNLFSVSQMCDKKNSVLFTNTGCFVLSPGFKLADESRVLHKVPKKNNMYSVNMKNIVPKQCLTCLVAKAILDESMLWHRRLSHVNFKTINKLVKENLVRGLPTKRFENDQTCVACLKGKQHKASCIKREFSIARTPQQNGVAKRRNRTLIEAARTMLADSKLPTTF
ncbi:ribonuclease H-like domain-containing protein [Tanacetum coccineum]